MFGLIQPPGAFLLSEIPEGEVKKIGGLFKNSNDKDVYDSLLVLLPHILQHQYKTLRVKYTNSIN